MKGDCLLRILITDDSATNRKLFTLVAERMGIHADAAASGREALALFQAQSYDMAFFDLNMPQMDGFALARSIQQHNPRRIPLYAVSGFMDAETEIRALGAGYCGCFPKPLDREKILRAAAESGLSLEPAPQDMPAATDIPLRLLPVYAEELRARAAACQRYWQAQDTAALRREAHTLRALADMLKTENVAQAAARIEHIQGGADTPEHPHDKNLRALYAACLHAAAAIEKAASSAAQST